MPIQRFFSGVPIERQVALKHCRVLQAQFKMDRGQAAGAGLVK